MIQRNCIFLEVDNVSNYDIHNHVYYHVFFILVVFRDKTLSFTYYYFVPRYT